jgi:nickel-dependent lactate racemase
MRRFGTPEDLPGTVLWLLSPASRFVTGVIILWMAGSPPIVGVRGIWMLKQLPARAVCSLTIFVQQTLHQGLGGKLTGHTVLILIPDHTRTIPLPALFGIWSRFCTTPNSSILWLPWGPSPLTEAQLCQRVGITAEEHQTTFQHIGLLNHAWDQSNTLIQIGTLPQAQVQTIAGDLWHPSLGGDVPVRINRAALAYDHILILGPTFPHEVAGFSGGAKYLFPGISGPEMINTTHWLGALAGVIDTIGFKQTAVRAMIHAAAGFVATPITLIALVVLNEGLAAIFIGEHETAWNAASDLSSQRHILWYEKPFRRVLSSAPPMYEELWTAGKAMYKLEPVLADGGELIIYAPHLREVSRVHGKYIYAIGYHVLDYFLQQWDRFRHVPLGVLAHSTHVRGAGQFRDGIEYAHVDVTLASQITPEECARLNLGYCNPAEINLSDWQNREDEGILFVEKAGEMLYRVKS